MIRSLLLFVLLVALAAAGIVEHRAPGTLTRDSGPDGSVLQVLPPPFAGQQLLRFVLVGSDDRPHLPGRSDIRKASQEIRIADQGESVTPE